MERMRRRRRRSAQGGTLCVHLVTHRSFKSTPFSSTQLNPRYFDAGQLESSLSRSTRSVQLNSTQLRQTQLEVTHLNSIRHNSAQFSSLQTSQPTGLLGGFRRGYEPLTKTKGVTLRIFTPEIGKRSLFKFATKKAAEEVCRREKLPPEKNPPRKFVA